MTLKRTPLWAAGLGCALILAGSPLACGGGGKDDNGETGGDAGSGNDGETGGKGSASGGKGSTGSGGKGSTADGGMGGGDTGAGGKGSTGAGGGGTTAGATINDLIAALCQREFECCEAGEITYRFGSTASTADECTADFTRLYEKSNEAASPFPTLSGLLITLGYTVDPARVSENPAGIAECIEAQKALECPMLVEDAPTAPTYCTPGVTGKDPCALNNLFKPKLKAGDECTFGLTEGGWGNDVECETGTTCLSPDDEDNSKDYSACVTRGVKGDGCTKDVDCDYNFYCDAGDCKEKGDEGDACSFNKEDKPMPGDENAGCKGGLICSPETLKCVGYCKADYPCVDNAQCPEGLSCRPTTIGDDSTSWKLCQDIGETAEARCDDDGDCSANRYCDGSVCQSDKSIEDPCMKDAMCEAGSYCDGYACAALIQAGKECTPGAGTNSGCVASAKRCLSDPESDYGYPTYICVKDLRTKGQTCVSDTECKAGLKCEVTTDDPAVVWPRTCTDGAKAGADCDSDTTDPEKLQCGAGLMCNKDGKCSAQLNAGEDCEDPDSPGYQRDDFCKNSDCVENWDEDGVDYICSDALVPKTNGGDGHICSYGPSAK